MTSSRSAKAALLAVGKVLTQLVGIAIAAVLARMLSKHDLATYRQTMLAYAMVGPLFMLGLPNALNYFLAGDEDRPRGLLIDNLLLLAGMGFVFSLGIILGGDELLAWHFGNPDLAANLRLLAPYPLFMLPAAALGAVLVQRNRVRSLTIYNVLSRGLTGVAVIACFLVWPSTETAVAATTVTAGLVLVPALWMMWRAVPPDGKPTRPSLAGMRAQLAYSVPLGIAGLLGTLTLQIDKFIVSSLCSTEDFAVYSTGAMELPLITVVATSISAVLLPDMARLCKADRRQEALALWSRAGVRSALLLFPAAVLFFLLAEETMTVLYSDAYAESALPFRINLLLIPMRIVTWGLPFLALGLSGIVFKRSVLALVSNAAFSVLGVYLLGYNGAALATVLTMYTWWILSSMLLIRDAYDVPLARILDLRALGRVAALSLAAGVVVIPRFLWPPESALLSALIYGSLYGLAAFALLYRYGPVDLRPFVQRVRRRLRR
ncbi:MAG: oligosaccharide flippase family protein [bacterium]